MICQLCSAADSDQYNPDDWDALQTEEKDGHLWEASAVMIAEWECADVVWCETDPVPEDIQNACARLAYHSFKGTLYDTSGTKSTKREKVDVIEVEYFQGGDRYSSSPYPDVETILKASDCTRTSGGSTAPLERV